MGVHDQNVSAAVLNFTRAFLIIVFALPLIISLLVQQICLWLFKKISWPIVFVVQLYIKLVQYLFVRYVYSTRAGRCHLMCSKRKGGVREQHSHLIRVQICEGCSVFPIPTMANNYSYLIVGESRQSGDDSRRAVLIDVSDADTVLDAVAAIEEDHYGGEGIDICAVLTTHKHWDHSGGNEEMRRRIPGLRVYGGAKESVPGATDEALEGRILSFWENSEIEVFETPCHTVGHVVFRLRVKPLSLKEAAPDCLFTGDTLFLGSFGALFEGNNAEMLQNLAKIARVCPPETLIFPGHEYTAQNLQSTMNEMAPFECPYAYLATASLWWRAVHLRWWHRGMPTVPGRLADEHLTHSKFRKLKRFAGLVQAAAQRPRDERDSVSMEEMKDLQDECSDPSEFVISPQQIGLPFVAVWRSDWEKLLALLRARRMQDVLAELQSAEVRFQTWEEHWMRGGKGAEPEVPCEPELAEALEVLGCRRKGAGVELQLLCESMKAFGHPVNEDELALLKEKCLGSEELCKGKEGIRRLATEVLRNREFPEPAIQGLSPGRCHACREGRCAAFSHTGSWSQPLSTSNTDGSSLSLEGVTISEIPEHEDRNRPLPSHGVFFSSDEDTLSKTRLGSVTSSTFSGVQNNMTIMEEDEDENTTLDAGPAHGVVEPKSRMFHASQNTSATELGKFEQCTERKSATSSKFTAVKSARSNRTYTDGAAESSITRGPSWMKFGDRVATKIAETLSGYDGPGGAINEGVTSKSMSAMRFGATASRTERKFQAAAQARGVTQRGSARSKA